MKYLCRYYFPYTYTHTRYQILCPKQLQGVADPKKAADLILQTTGLADDAFRLGATKAWFPNSFLFLFKYLSRCCYKTILLNNFYWYCDYFLTTFCTYIGFTMLWLLHHNIELFFNLLIDWSIEVNIRKNSNRVIITFNETMLNAICKFGWILRV